MAQPEQKLTSPVSLAVDAVLIGLFFIGMYLWVSPHVPTKEASMRLLWGGLCAACVTGVFWMCIQMFRVVLMGQRARNRK